MRYVDIQVWILTGLVGSLLILGWWSARNWITTISEKIDQLITAVQKQSESNIKQAVEINNLTKRVDTADNRLNDHSKRIKNIEIKQGHAKF